MYVSALSKLWVQELTRTEFKRQCDSMGVQSIQRRTRFVITTGIRDDLSPTGTCGSDTAKIYPPSAMVL